VHVVCAFDRRGGEVRSESRRAFRALVKKAPDPTLPGDDQRRLFAHVIAAVQVGLYVWELEDPDDPAGMRLVHANPATMVATGVAPEEIVGQTLREAFPAMAETKLPAIYAVVALGAASRDLGDVVYSDERIEESVFSVRVFPLPERRVGIAFNDVTSERRAEARVLDTLESMSDAFYTLDRDWRFTYVNPRGELLLQRQPGELLGASVWAEFPEAVESRFHDEFQRAAREQVTVELEEYYLPFDAWFWVRAYPSPDGLAVYYQDVTARRELEAQFLQAQKLEAVGQLAGGVAHDFNNLLTVIDGYAALAQEKLTSESPFVQQALEEIGSASARAAALTAKLLAFSRKQMLQSTVADLNEIVSGALSLIEPLIGEHIRIHRLLDRDSGHALVDAGQIEQVIVNLALNARDAMLGGGNLYFTTEPVELAPGAVPELEPGHYVALRVRDDGCGMDEETQKQIFDPFFTTKPVGEGTGLGLSTAYGTISQSGGHIDVTSEPGEGTTFTLYLPRSDAQVVPSRDAASSEPRSGGGERILVVEDEETVRRLIVRMLESYGYDLVEARNPQEALVICAAGRFDLMVTDVVMPGGDGPALARAAAERQPGLRVLYTSGYMPRSIAHLDLQGSETAFLPKPFSSDELANQVREILDRR
jgi:two-component system cell cycle sensor histidine kinase/response regulator CckA